MDAEQVTDIQLSEFLSNSDTSLKLQHLQIGPDVKLNCDVSAKKVWPYVPESLRYSVFWNLHGLSHPSVWASCKLIQERFVWPEMLKDIAKWIRSCIDCQKSKIHPILAVPLDNLRGWSMHISTSWDPASIWELYLHRHLHRQIFPLAWSHTCARHQCGNCYSLSCYSLDCKIWCAKNFDHRLRPTIRIPLLLCFDKDFRHPTYPNYPISSLQ